MKQLRIVTVVVFAATAAAPTLGGAQLPSGTVPDSASAATLGLTPGMRVRYATVLDPHRLYVAELRRAGRDSLWFVEARAVAIAGLSRLEVRTGQRRASKRIGTGALWGAAIGGVLGAMPWANPDAIVGPRSRTEGAALGALVGVVVGGLGGALLGSDSWREVRLRSARAGQGPAA